MQKRLCGKVQVRLTSGACATVPLNPLQRVVVSALFVFVEFNGSAKATVMTCCRSFFFVCLFAPLFPSPPALCRYLPLRVVFVLVRETAGIIRVIWSVQQQLSSSCCFVRAAGICCSSSARMLFFLQPFLSNLLASHSSENLPFVFALFSLFLHLFFLFFSFVIVWLVLLYSRMRYTSISPASP